MVKASAALSRPLRCRESGFVDDARPSLRAGSGRDESGDDLKGLLKAALAFTMWAMRPRDVHP